MPCSSGVTGCSGFGRYQAVETSAVKIKLALLLSCSGFGRYQAVETQELLHNVKSFFCCSGFGRYQAVETRGVFATLKPLIFVAVGLAAIRPLKHDLTFNRINYTLALQWVWPLSGR